MAAIIVNPYCKISASFFILKLVFTFKVLIFTLNLMLTLFFLLLFFPDLAGGNFSLSLFVCLTCGQSLPPYFMAASLGNHFLIAFDHHFLVIVAIQSKHQRTKATRNTQLLYSFP